MNNTFRIAALLNAVTANYQRDQLVANLRQSKDNPYVTLLARLADRWDQTPTTMQMYGATPGALVRWHFTHAANEYWLIAKQHTERTFARAYGLEHIPHLTSAPRPCYISVPEILSHGAWLDLDFEPKTVREITWPFVA